MGSVFVARGAWRDFLEMVYLPGSTGSASWEFKLRVKLCSYELVPGSWKTASGPVFLSVVLVSPPPLPFVPGQGAARRRDPGTSAAHRAILDVVYSTWQQRR